MRRAFAIAVLSALLATAAAAQSERPSPAQKAGLRGPIAAPSAAPAPPQAPAAPLFSPVPAQTPRPDRCRLSCAQDYYFCLSDQRADDCPGAWGQCRAACAARERAAPGVIG